MSPWVPWGDIIAEPLRVTESLNHSTSPKNRLTPARLLCILNGPEDERMSRFKVDIRALQNAERTALVELDDHIARIFQREAEQKRRDEEKAKKKKAKRKRY